ncbi:DUF4252 domain-containing protein [Pontimicrobium sp. IMCC45349]|jgi:hypothetical protein|uniref:DUF4252 domain-containing protein n=1 Tax=Pontimicrobium sp. IMCC45349 TaxID=3391574 RepID=UPI0039A350F8
MKKLVLIIAIVVAPIMSFGQSLFDKYEDLEVVTSVVVNQKMFSMLAQIDVETDDPEADQFINMVKSLKSLKVLTTGDAKVAGEMKADVAKYLRNSSLEELMRIKDGDQTVKFYVKEGKDENHVKELLMFVTGLKEVTKNEDIVINGKKREIETVLLSLTGDIDLRQVSKLTSQMNVPGGKHLEKAGEKQN